MLELDTLNKFDPQGMYKVYNRWPEIAKEAYDSEHDIAKFANIDHVVFSGMGHIIKTYQPDLSS